MIIGSCGHELKNENQVCTKDFDRTGKHVIVFSVICDICLEQYMEDGIILETKKDQEKWLQQTPRDLY